jgi:hypothetical protein
LASEAVDGRHAGEFVPVYTRLAEIENTVEKRLRETAEVSPWFGTGLLHWLCKICGHHDPAMYGKNWVDEDDPSEARSVRSASAMGGAKEKRNASLWRGGWLRTWRQAGASLARRR